MTSKAFFHYTLAFMVLFASSFTVFHGSEHIAIEKTGSGIPSLMKSADSSFHYESERRRHNQSHNQSHSHSHSASELDPSGTSHSADPLCKACLLLSNLSAYSQSGTYLGFIAQQNKPQRFRLFYSERQALLAYLTRAPPRNA